MPLFNVAVREHTYTGRFYSDVVQASSFEEALQVAAQQAAAPPPPSAPQSPSPTPQSPSPTPQSAPVPEPPLPGPELRPGPEPSPGAVQAPPLEETVSAAAAQAAAPGPPPAPAPQRGFSVVVTEQADTGRFYSDIVQAASPQQALQVAAVQAAAQAAEPGPPPDPAPQAEAAGPPRCSDVWVYALLQCELQAGHDPPHMAVAPGYRRPVRWVRDDLGVAHDVPAPAAEVPATAAEVPGPAACAPVVSPVTPPSPAP